MSNIQCRVEECHYNQNELCQASTIEVNAMVKDHMVSTTRDTSCETFVPKVKMQ
ncbi:MAG: DUF1540 domain-containing protein [Firmicutes bacterium]|nr:DUF1540 domain-containing protein [Bacillota bacterium]